MYKYIYVYIHTFIYLCIFIYWNICVHIYTFTFTGSQYIYTLYTHTFTVRLPAAVGHLQVAYSRYQILLSFFKWICFKCRRFLPNGLHLQVKFRLIFVLPHKSESPQLFGCYRVSLHSILLQKGTDSDFFSDCYKKKVKCVWFVVGHLSDWDEVLLCVAVWVEVLLKTGSGFRGSMWQSVS